MGEKKVVDQAEKLREKMTDTNGQVDVFQLPPRSEIHRDKRKKQRQKDDRIKKWEDKRNRKKRKKRMDDSLIRFLLVLFIILVLVSITSPLWMERLVF